MHWIRSEKLLYIHKTLEFIQGEIFHTCSLLVLLPYFHFFCVSVFFHVRFIREIRVTVEVTIAEANDLLLGHVEVSMHFIRSTSRYPLTLYAGHSMVFGLVTG